MVVQGDYVAVSSNVKECQTFCQPATSRVRNKPREELEKKKNKKANGTFAHMKVTEWTSYFGDQIEFGIFLWGIKMLTNNTWHTCALVEKGSWVEAIFLTQLVWRNIDLAVISSRLGPTPSGQMIRIKERKIYWAQWYSVAHPPLPLSHPILTLFSL